MNPDLLRSGPGSRGPYDRDTFPNAPGEADPTGDHPLQIKAQEKRRRKAAKRVRDEQRTAYSRVRRLGVDRWMAILSLLETMSAPWP